MPTVEDEAFRDLVRTWGATKQDLKQARQRLKAFLLAHDVRYTGRADWGPSHRHWISGYSFDSHWQQLAFEEHRRTIEDRLAQCERLETALREMAPQWRFYPVVETLQALRGVQFTTAIGMLAEFGDLSRFDHLRLCKRYRKLVARGKHPNVAVVAIARELAALIWDIARMTSVRPGVQTP